jgi:hypothetical protein
VVRANANADANANAIGGGGLRFANPPYGYGFFVYSMFV